MKTDVSKIKPGTLIIIGIIYFVWPLDFPTFIDDIIVNLLCCGGAFYLNLVRKKAEKKINEVANSVKSKSESPSVHKLIDEAQCLANTAVDSANVIAKQKLDHCITEHSKVHETTADVQPINAFKTEMSNKIMQDR